MEYSDILERIEGYEEISDEGAKNIIAALARKVPLDEVEEEQPKLAKSSGVGGLIHTHVSSLTTRDAWLSYLWLRDASDVLGHIPAHLACLKATFKNTVGDAYVDRAVGVAENKARGLVTDGPAPRPPGLEEQPEEQPE